MKIKTGKFLNYLAQSVMFLTIAIIIYFTQAGWLSVVMMILNGGLGFWYLSSAADELDKILEAMRPDQGENDDAE